LTCGGVALAIVGVILLAGAVASAILLLITYDRQARQRQLRARDAVSAQAEVVNVRVRRGDHPQRILTYRYEVEGRLYSGTASFGERQHRDIVPGSLAEIGYVPSQPGESWMIGHEPSGLPLLLVPLVPAVLLVGAGAIAWGLRRQRMLLSEGRGALARVTGHTKVQRDKHRAFRVKYEFETLSGATSTGSFEVGKNPPPAGTLVPIVYHRDNPRWSARYPLQLVRISGREDS
jgi:hypothetical protein